MLTPETLRTAIVLCLRAPLKGEEARNTVAALDALEAMYNLMTAPPPEPDGKPKEKKDGKHARPNK